MSAEKRSALYAGWQKAVARACDWEEHESTIPPTTKL
jgi:glycerol kinase